MKLRKCENSKFMNLSKFIDSTLLKSTATKADIAALCRDSVEYGFFGVCVNPCFVEYARGLLKKSDVKVVSVVGFPLGASTTSTKVHEAKQAIKNGADELDMVINISALKEKNYQYVLNEINEIKAVAGDKILKVIIEISQLTRDEIIKMCEIVNQSDAEFIKTSTGFVGSGTDPETVEFMAKLMKKEKFVKASSGIRDHKTAMKMVRAGASRLGTSSAVTIIQNAPKKD